MFLERLSQKLALFVQPMLYVFVLLFLSIPQSQASQGPKTTLNFSSVSPRIYISRLSFLCSIPVYKETRKYAAWLTPTSGRAIGCF